MIEVEFDELDHRIDLGIKTAIAEALEDHRRNGRTVVVWEDGRIKHLTGDEIKPLVSGESLPSPATGDANEESKS